MANKQSNKKDKKSSTYFFGILQQKNKTWHSFSIKLKLCLTSIMLTITQFQSEFFSLKIEKTHKIGLSVTLFEHFVYY